jgi:hypothetical protein
LRGERFAVVNGALEAQVNFVKLAEARSLLRGDLMVIGEGRL